MSALPQTHDFALARFLALERLRAPDLSELPYTSQSKPTAAVRADSRSDAHNFLAVWARGRPLGTGAAALGSARWIRGLLPLRLVGGCLVFALQGIQGEDAAASNPQVTHAYSLVEFPRTPLCVSRPLRKASIFSHWCISFQIAACVSLQPLLTRLSLSRRLRPGATLADFKMEARGDLLADYIMLTAHDAARPLYEQVVRAFLNDPADRRHLPSLW